MEKCIDNIDNRPHQLLKNDPTTKSKLDIETIKDSEKRKTSLLKTNYIAIWHVLTCLHLDFTVNQIYATKDFLPICLIVSYSGSPLLNLSKDIDNILQVCTEDENNNTKNSTTFSNYSRNVPIENDKIIVSSDVTSLY